MTNPNLENRKSSLIAQLALLQDETIVSKIEDLLHPKSDWWDDLSNVQKKSIEKGIEELNRGEFVRYSDFIANYKASR